MFYLLSRGEIFEPRFDLEVQQQAAQQICEEGLRYDLESLHCRRHHCHVGGGTFDRAWSWMLATWEVQHEATSWPVMINIYSDESSSKLYGLLESAQSDIWILGSSHFCISPWCSRRNVKSAACNAIGRRSIQVLPKFTSNKTLRHERSWNYKDVWCMLM